MRRSALVATLAAASVVLAACDISSSVPHAGPTSTQVTTAVDDAKATTTAMPPAPVPAQSGEYLDVSGFPVALEPRDAVDNAQFGATAQPGIKVLHLTNANGDMDACTLGPQIEKRDGSGSGFLTAGHCAVGDFAAQQFLQTTTDGETSLLATAKSPLIDDELGQDAVALWTGGSAAQDATPIAGTFPVTGVMSETNVRKLKSGTPICVDAAETGVKCSPLASTAGWIEFPEITAHGDSGAPVFLVDSQHRAILIGLIKGLDKTTGNDAATYLEPVLAQLGAAPVLAP